MIPSYFIEYIHYAPVLGQHKTLLLLQYDMMSTRKQHTGQSKCKHTLPVDFIISVLHTSCCCCLDNHCIVWILMMRTHT